MQNTIAASYEDIISEQIEMLESSNKVEILIDKANAQLNQVKRIKKRAAKRKGVKYRVLGGDSRPE